MLPWLNKLTEEGKNSKQGLNFLSDCFRDFSNATKLLWSISKPKVICSKLRLMCRQYPEKGNTYKQIQRPTCFAVFEWQNVFPLLWISRTPCLHYAWPQLGQGAHIYTYIAQVASWLPPVFLYCACQAVHTASLSDQVPLALGQKLWVYRSGNRPYKQGGGYELFSIWIIKQSFMMPHNVNVMRFENMDFYHSLSLDSFFCVNCALLDSGRRLNNEEEEGIWWKYQSKIRLFSGCWPATL